MPKAIFYLLKGDYNIMTTITIMPKHGPAVLYEDPGHRLALRFGVVDELS